MVANAWQYELLENIIFHGNNNKILPPADGASIKCEFY